MTTLRSGPPLQTWSNPPRRTPGRSVLFALLALALVVMMLTALSSWQDRRANQALPAAPAGQHWETYLDLAVLVPDEWTAQPISFQGATCEQSRKSGVVVYRPIDSASPPCEGELIAPYLAFRPISVSRHSFELEVVGHGVDAAQQQAIDTALATARRTSQDAHGCPVSSARLPEFSMPSSPLTAMAACLYASEPFGLQYQNANYYNGVSLAAAEAQKVWAAILAAPLQDSLAVAQGGCPVYQPTPLGLVLRTGDRETTVWVHYDACGKTGIQVGDEIYALTPENCRPLFSGALRQAGRTLDARCQ